MLVTEKISISVLIGLSLLSFSLYPHRCKAQQQQEVDKTLQVGQVVYVIQPSGVSLRETPHPSGKTLAHIKYGQKIKITKLLNDQSDRVLDTIDWPKFSGYWIQVTFEKQKGYLFSTHVFENLNSVNKNAVLLFEYDGCAPDFKYDARLKYYGFYRTANGVVVKKVTPSFFVERSVTGLGDGHLFRLRFQASRPFNGPAEMLFVLGMEGNLVEGMIKELSLSEKQRTIVGSAIKYLPEAHMTLQANEGMIKIEQEIPLRRQTLFLYGSQRIDWCGDLDQDGKLDFLFTAADKGVTATLFLSSLAKEHEIVGYAGSFFFPLCC
jgi:hypothetical protein